MKRATQKDVAARAGVSRATVSYVLNGRTDGTIRVSDETRQKVLDAIGSLRYRVNLTARGLKTRRSHLLAVLVPDLGNPFYPMLIRGAQKMAHASGYRILVFDSFSTREDELDFLKMALDRIADGLILAASYLDDSHIKILRDEGIPSVGIGPYLRNTGIDTLSIDQPAAVHALIEHLVSRGHTRVGHITGDLNNINGRIRYDAFRAEMAARGLPVDPHHILEGDFLREGTARKVEQWLSSLAPGERPTAVFAANDLMAIEAITAARRLGLSVPEDLAVCGFDNIPEAEFVEPPLTTVGLDVEAMGRRAATLLIDRIAGTRVTGPEQVGLDFDFYVRRST